MHNKFNTFQLVEYKIIPADKDPKAWVEKTIKSFNP